MKTLCGGCGKVLTSESGERLHNGHFDSAIARFKPPPDNDTTWAFCERCYHLVKGLSMSLTREEILAMPAGPALDRLVAEQRLGMVACDGWQQINFGAAGGPALMKTDECKHAAGQCYPRLSVESIHGTAGGCPQFSTDRFAMLQLIDAMEELDYWCQLRTPYQKGHDPVQDGYWVGFTTHGQGWMDQPQHWVRGMTLPHAAAMSALLTLVKDD